MATATSGKWTYHGFDAGGKKVKGTIEATSEAHAFQQLRSKGIMPEEVREQSGGTGLNKEIEIEFLQRGPSLKDLALLTRQLSTMVAAGVSILRALSIVQAQVDNAKLRKALVEVTASVEGGIALSDALAQFPIIFPPIMIHLIRAGETGGFLDRSLIMVADNFEAETKLRSKVKAALTYPVVVLIIALLAVAAMLIFIVPVFEKMFADLGGELPGPTQLLVTLSKAMPIAGPIIAIVVIAAMIWWGRMKNTPGVRAVVDPIKLKVPVFGKLNKKIALTRFARNFSTMMASGVPVLQSLTIVGSTADNAVISNALQRVHEEVRQGLPIGTALAREEVFPEMLVQMVAIGEESGSVDAMLEKVAVFYDDEVETMSSQLTALLEPLMIVFMGALLGFMIVALYMPMFMIFQQIQSL